MLLVRSKPGGGGNSSNSRLCFLRVELLRTSKTITAITVAGSKKTSDMIGMIFSIGMVKIALQSAGFGDPDS